MRPSFPCSPRRSASFSPAAVSSGGHPSPSRPFPRGRFVHAPADSGRKARARRRRGGVNRTSTRSWEIDMRIVVLALCALLTLPALAKEREGVTAPPLVQVTGKPLRLMGMGLRKKLWFKVYLASFYLEHLTEDGAEAVSSEQIKQVRMHMLRDLEREK